MYVPSKVFFVDGVGRHEEEIASFEMALRDAGIEPYNIVNVSSILPPDVEIVERDEGVNDLSRGQIVHTVMSRCTTKENKEIGASVGVASPVSEDEYGYLIEKTSVGKDIEDVGEKARSLASELLDAENEIDSFETTATAKGEEGVWTTAIAAAVFVP